MKFFCFVILFITFAFYSFAEDIICFKNGDIVKAEISEITSTEVKYKKSSNPSGPFYIINKSEILSIQYANGEIERFVNTYNEDMTNNTSLILMGNERSVPCASDNQELINNYNILFEPKVKPSSKKSDDYCIKWGITSESVISNEEVTISFSLDYVYPFGIILGAPYNLKVSNKSDKTIIFDLARCYRVSQTGKTNFLFDNNSITSVSSNNGTSVGASIGLPISNLFPSIGVGKNYSHSTITTYTPNQMISIPPHSYAYISKNTLAPIKKKEYKFITVGEGFNGVYLEKGKILKNVFYNYDENNSPGTFTYCLTYTTADRPYEFSEIKFTTFVRQIFCGCSWNDLWFNKEVGDTISLNDMSFGYCDDVRNFYKPFYKLVTDFNPDFLILGGN